MKAYLNGRVAEVDLSIERHHCDSYFESGYWIDTEIDCTDEELGDLTEANGDAICEACMEEAGTWID